MPAVEHSACMPDVAHSACMPTVEHSACMPTVEHSAASLYTATDRMCHDEGDPGWVAHVATMINTK